MICYIFGALPINNFNCKISNKDIVIAADAGLINAKKLNITPDYIIGDFDSLNSTPKGKNVIQYPIEKNDTDTLLAIKKGFELGYSSFIILGCIGGRLDHTFANIEAASYVVSKSGRCVFIGEKESLTVLENNNIHFDEYCKGNISIFSLTEKSFGVNISNLYYTLINGTLTYDFPLGVSNKFINKKSEISVEAGRLLVIWENSVGSYSMGGN